MIILLSPAKTFAKAPSLSQIKPMFFKDSLILEEKLKKLSLDDIQENMKLSHKLSKTVYDHYQHLGKITYKAIEAYQGQVYKSLDYSSLNSGEKTYIQKNLFIVSGLYGLVKPLDGISYYRLEMQDQTITNLYHYWSPLFSSFLHTHKSQEILLSLCSKEYEKAFEGYPISTIDFVSKTKIHSMALKTLRGHFVRLMAIHDIKTLDELKNLNVDGFVFDSTLSKKNHYVFKKD